MIPVTRLSIVFLFASACANDQTDVEPYTPEPADAASGETCERGLIESDFQAPTPDGMRAPEIQVPPGSYVISTTYLQLRQDDAGQARFGALMPPIMAELSTRSGLVAVSLGGSQRCGTARTLSVWEDETAMLGFVTSEAHLAAMGAVTEVSRGGSLVTHWAGDETTVTWQSAAEHAAADDGPFY